MAKWQSGSEGSNMQHQKKSSAKKAKAHRNETMAKSAQTWRRINEDIMKWRKRKAKISA